MVGSVPKVYVIGVGMTKFERPGRRKDFDYPQMAAEAVTKALKDAGLRYADIEQACVGYVYGDSTCGQRALYEVGMSGIPVFNVNNNCSTGASALMITKQIIESGNASCALALGFEKMERGSLISKFDDRTNPMDKHLETMVDMAGLEAAPMAAQLFGNAGKEHMSKYGTEAIHFAKIAYKNHKHSMKNPYAQFQEEYSLEQILQSPPVFSPLTKLQCCPTSDGSAAAILANEEFVLRHGLQYQAVLIVGMEMCSDLPSTFTSKSHMNLVGYEMTRSAANKLFSKSGYIPSDVDVVELHDCFSVNELITYEALGLCPPGEAAEFIDSRNNTYGGRHVVNPSGGLISKGHPLGATGLAQCAELCWQLRGQADKRQVPNAHLALQHNIGLGGAVVVALYRLGFPDFQQSARVSTSPTAIVGDLSTFKAPMTLIIEAMLNDKSNMIEKVDSIYGMKVKNTATQKEPKVIIKSKVSKEKEEFNSKGKPDVTFTINDENTADLALTLTRGIMIPPKVFIQWKTKLQGEIGMAQNPMELPKKASSDRIEELRAKL